MSRDLIVCSLESWDDVWRRNQYLLDGLLRGDPDLRVLLVEPPADPLHAARRRVRPRLGRGLRRLDGYDGRLYALQPTKLLPRVAGPLADRMLAASVRRAARRLRMERPVLWVNDPNWAHLAGTGWPAIYDITDDWVEADRSPREHDRIVANEGRLMRECTVVVVCSTGLLATKSPIRPVELIQNGVDVAWYRRPQPRPDDLPAAPTALYVGTLHEDRLDVDLGVAIGTRLASLGGTLVFVGPDALSTAHTRRLRETAGVVLLGPRPHTAIPGYLQHADVLVVPHVVNDFTESLDPIKLYEYQAIGRPIASTPVAGFRELDGVAGVAVAPRETLPGAIADLIASPPGQVGPFDAQDWSVRVAAMDDVLRRAGVSGAGVR
ncbi:glycosyltransferase [Propionicicella superfundia]|uniref:glycosyltransferase n=1 Tax=Propionicicella superfundia TaxID=348582 RepID=UPI00041DAEB0|nr:glycosyltransferase [Propionicicella superfundia]